MEPQAGETKQPANHEHPLVGYRMWGVPCANCGLPMEGMWLFRSRIEVWHSGTGQRCHMEYAPSHVVELPPISTKPDKRKLSRKYRRCAYCDSRFVIPRQEPASEDVQDLCKSCRNQQGLFTNDEIARLQDHVPADPE